MKPVTITHGVYADVTIIDVIPAAPGLFVLEKWEIPEDPADDDLRGSPVLSWCVDEALLLHYPNKGNGVIQADFCVFDAGGTVIKIDGFDIAGIKTVRDWCAAVRAENSRLERDEAVSEMMAKAYKRTGEHQAR